MAIRQSFAKISDLGDNTPQNLHFLAESKKLTMRQCDKYFSLG
jgi:hypothetical protein